jgi:hypothetical protein
MRPTFGYLDIRFPFIRFDSSTKGIFSKIGKV